METEHWLTVVQILALATYAVSRSSLTDLVESGDVSHTSDSSMSVAQRLALQLTPHTVSVTWVSIIMAPSPYFSYPNVSAIRIPSSPNVSYCTM